MDNVLDRIDRELLALLQADGRLSAQALSERVHLSARATLNRVRRLEDAGLIVSYRAQIDREAAGANVCLFIEVTLKEHRKSTAQLFEQRMREAPEVLGCWLVSGRYDYLLRLACRDLPHYRALTSGWLDDLTLAIGRIVTNTELATVKEFAGFPVVAGPQA